MAWVIKIKTSAKHEIKRFDHLTQKLVIDALEELSQAKNPRALLVPYSGPLVGYYKKRIGQYRLIIDIQDTALILEIVKAGHRSKVYK